MSCLSCITKVFRKIDFNDIELVKKYLEISNYEESNHNLVNIFEWLELYPLYEYHEDDYMILIGTYHDEFFVYMPLCKEDMVFDVIRKAKILLDNCNIPLVLSCFTKEIKNKIEKDKTLKILDIRDGYDYVYDLAKMRSFSGKKLQKKRNHLNNFYKIYGDRYSYEELNDDNLKELIDYVNKLEGNEESLIFEKRGIINILNYRKELDIKCAIIRIDGKIEAFLIASVLSDRMIQENVEKSNKNIQGLAIALIKEFFTRNYQEYLYLNREDDMGIENLRVSKLSYDPLYLIEKFSIYEN